LANGTRRRKKGGKVVPLKDQRNSKPWKKQETGDRLESKIKEEGGASSFGRLAPMAAVAKSYVIEVDIERASRFHQTRPPWREKKKGEMHPPLLPITKGMEKEGRHGGLGSVVEDTPVGETK